MNENRQSDTPTPTTQTPNITEAKNASLGISLLQGTLSLLANVRSKKLPLFVRSLFPPIVFAGLIALCPGLSRAYTVVTVSPKATEALETEFLSATTNQFDANLVVNALFPNTYQLTLNGINPNYNPPPSDVSLLNSIVTVDSYTYVYGWAGGVSYQQTQEEGLVGLLGNLCGSPTDFYLVQTTTGTFDRSTCQDVVSTIDQQLYQQSLSTAPVPGF